MHPHDEMQPQIRVWYPYVSPFDPCPPIRVKTYQVNPQLFMGFQPPCLPQYPPMEALHRGVLWPALFSPYEGRGDQEGLEGCSDEQ